VSWFRIDDGFYDHPKVIALRATRAGKGAIALWALAGSWCSRHLTDGVVPAATVGYLGGTPAEVEALVSSGLWARLELGAGFSFVGWEERNPTRREVEERRAKTADKVRSWRKNKGNGPAGGAPIAACNPVTVSGSTSARNPAPGPTRPVPDHDLTRTLDPVAGEAGAREGGAGPTQILEGVFQTAIGAAGGVYRQRTGDALAFREAADAIRASDPRPLRDAAAEWCRDFVGEYRVRTPRNLAEYAQARAGNGGRKVQAGRGRRDAYQAPATAEAFEATDLDHVFGNGGAHG